MSVLYLAVMIFFTVYLNYLYKNILLISIIIIFSMEWVSNLLINPQLPIFIWIFQKLNNPIFNVLLLFYILIFYIVIYRVYYKNINLFYLIVWIYLIITYLHNNFFITVSNLNFFKVSDISVKLLNGLIMIHPISLYIFYSILIIFFFKIYFFRIYFYKNIQYLYFFTDYKIYLFGIISLFLGSWWSAQELNWGGFWSWDLVEIFLLVSVVFSIILAHTKYINSFFFYKLIFFFFNYILYICSVRFNLINSIHNFISSSSFFYKYTYIILLILVSIVYLFRLLLYYKNTPLLSIVNYNLLLLNIIYFLLIAYIAFTYIYFFAFNQTSISLVNVIPNILIPFLENFLIKYLNFFFLFFPMNEVLTISVLLLAYVRYNFISITHIILIIIFYLLTLYFNITLLVPLDYAKLKFNSLCYNNNHILTSTSLNIINLNNLPQLSIFLSKIQSYIDLNIDFLSPTSILSLVINSNSILSNFSNYTLFFYKHFSKITFIDNLLYLILLLFFFKVYYTFKKSNFFF